MPDAALRPHPLRVLLAFCTAPVAAGTAFAAISTTFLPDKRWPFLDAAAFLSMIAGYITLFIAVPAYFVVRRRVQPSLANIATAGALVGVAPALALMAGNTAVEGKLSGDAVAVFVMSVPAGLAGGLAFWFCAVKPWRRNAVRGAA
jgi:hypothetical protein